MKKTLVLLLSLVALTGLSSCKFLYRSPKVEKVHELKVASIDPDKIKVELSLRVLNPNRYKLTLTDLEVDLLSKNREKIGAAKLSRSVEIPPKKSNALDFNLTLDTRPTVKLVNHSQQKVFVYIAGKGAGKVACSKQKFRFEEPFEIDVKEELQHSIASFQVSGEDVFKIKRSYLGKLGLTESQILVDFLIMNPYGFKFSLEEFPSTITIGNSETGRGNLDKALYFDETVYSREGTMIFKVNNLKAIYNLAKGAINGELSYRVDGDVNIRAYGVEFQKPYSYRDLITISITDELLKLIK